MLQVHWLMFKGPTRRNLPTEDLQQPELPTEDLQQPESKEES